MEFRGIGFRVQGFTPCAERQGGSHQPESQLLKGDYVGD